MSKYIKVNEGKLLKTRGKIINSVISVENAIQAFIADYFHKNDEEKWETFVTVVLDRFPFDTKIMIYEQLLRDILKTKFTKQHVNFISEIRSIKEHRNRFAHHICLHADKETILLMNIRNTAKHHTYDNTKIEEIITRAGICYLNIHNLGILLVMDDPPEVEIISI